MQFVGGHKFWPSCSSVVCLCAESPYAILCHKYISLGSQVAHMSQHRPEVAHMSEAQFLQHKDGKEATLLTKELCMFKAMTAKDC